MFDKISIDCGAKMSIGRAYRNVDILFLMQYNEINDFIKSNIMPQTIIWGMRYELNRMFG